MLKKQFRMTHLFFEGVQSKFSEDNPPDWLISKDFLWWWDGYILKLKVGKSINSDFQKITRLPDIRIKNKMTFLVELKKEIHGTSTSGFHFDKLSWVTKIWFVGICKLLDKKFGQTQDDANPHPKIIKQASMYLIEKLWIDTMENKNAYGYIIVGFVSSLKEAERICSLEHIKKSDYPWPLEHVAEFSGKLVPKYRYKIIPDITGYK